MNIQGHMINPPKPQEGLTLTRGQAYEMGKSPCELDCPHITQCTAEQMACLRFITFESTGKIVETRPRNPSKQYYKN